MTQHAKGKDGASVTTTGHSLDHITWSMLWTCDKWSDDAVDYAARRTGLLPWQVGSATFADLGVKPEQTDTRAGNLLLNEGIDRLLDLLIAAGGTSFNNANAYIGVGDTATAAAASQTELLGTQNAANRFYKAMNATFPSRASETVTWQSDFATGEANFHWQEWTIAAGATTASGSGFLVGTTNLNRKAEDLGTNASGVWTLSGAVTIS
jgi:hypothetical protein